MRLTIRAVAALNRFLTELGVVVASGLLVIMTGAVILQVISRTLRDPIGWTEELALSAMVWVAFLVGPWAYRQHELTRIDVVIEALSFRARSVLNLFIHLFEAVLITGAIWYSWKFFLGGRSVLPQLTRLTRDIAEWFVSPEVASAIVVQNKLVYFVLPLGFAAFLIVNLEHVLRAIMTIATGREHGVGREAEETHIQAGVTGATLPELDHAEDDDTDRGGRGR